MVNFNFYTSAETLGTVKATVQKSGKLGFSSGAIKLLKLDEEQNRLFKVASNSEDPNDKCLYLIRAKERDEDVFQAKKAGEYFYLRIKHVLNQMGIDYHSGGIIYDIIERSQEDTKYFQLKQREPTTRDKK